MIPPCIKYESCKIVMSTNRLILENLIRYLLNFKAQYGSSDGPLEPPGKKVELPPPPQNCCMSGCQNCVWVEYAKEISKILNDQGNATKQLILENVKDPNMQAFLLMELNILFKDKK